MDFLFDPHPLLYMIAGPGGSGKGRLLKELADLHAQVIDLENIACHNGSAFGNPSNHFQPSRNAFHASLIGMWKNTDLSSPVFMEMEGSFIGSLDLPESLYSQMLAAPVISLKTNFAIRISNIIEDYGSVPVSTHIESLERLKPRIGQKAFETCRDLITRGEFKEAVTILLDYYDHTRTYQVDQSKVILELKIDEPDYAKAAREVLEFLIAR